MGDIFSEHGVINPGRGKGTRLSRMGKKVHVSTQVFGRTTSPNEEALQQLNRLLEEHDGMPPEVRQQYIGLYRTSDELRHMNRPLLAEVMVLMYQNQIGTSGDSGEVSNLNVFSNSVIIQPYIDRVVSRTETSEQRGKMSELQKNIMSIKMTTTMFAYLRNILHLIATAQQRSQNADLSTLQAPQIDEQLDIAPEFSPYPAAISTATSSAPPIPLPAPISLPPISTIAQSPASAIPQSSGFSTLPTGPFNGSFSNSFSNSFPTPFPNSSNFPSAPLPSAPAPYQLPPFTPSATLLPTPQSSTATLTGYQPYVPDITPQLF